MASEREILEMNARAVAIMHVYREDPISQSRHKMMVAELRGVAEWFVAAKLTEQQLRRHVFEPIEAEFIDRYGPEAGERVNRGFAAVFRRKLLALGRSAP